MRPGLLRCSVGAQEHRAGCQGLSRLCFLRWSYEQTDDSMSTLATWHGTQAESFDLVKAVARNCACEFGVTGVRVSTCPVHQMLIEDQRALNGLLFVRRMADRLRREEFSTTRS